MHKQILHSEDNFEVNLDFLVWLIVNSMDFSLFFRFFVAILNTSSFVKSYIIPLAPTKLQLREASVWPKLRAYSSFSSVTCSKDLWLRNVWIKPAVSQSPDPAASIRLSVGIADSVFQVLCLRNLALYCNPSSPLVCISNGMFIPDCSASSAWF